MSEGIRSVDRRQFIKLAGVGATVSLAGCNEGDSGDLGERVPQISMSYWSDMGGKTNILEDMAPLIRDDFRNRLGVGVELVPTGVATTINDIFQDARTNHILLGFDTNTPDRLDPDEQLRRYGADWAGPNGNANTCNYVNCEYTHPAISQRNAATPEERRELVNEAQSVISNDVGGPIQLAPNDNLGAYRSDMVDLDHADAAGISWTNPEVMIHSSPTDGDRLVVNGVPTMASTLNFPTIVDSGSIPVWNHLVHSPLVGINSEYELENVLADNYEISDEGTTFTVELRDATFHNGDPITAEDVQFTFTHLSENASVFPHAGSHPYESIDVVDESTVEFNMSEAFLPLIRKVWTKWGIMHKQSWIEGGARDNPEGYSPDTIIGSGPFELSDMARESHLTLESTSMDHPKYNPDHDVFIQSFQGGTAAEDSFQAGDLHLITRISYSTADRLEEEMDNATVVNSKGFMPYSIFPQHPMPPIKFDEFREAVGMAINREKLNQIAFNGRNSPALYSTQFQADHPFRAPTDMLHEFGPAEGDQAGARAILEEQGWGWDDDGNLHYPPDADLSPLWTQGEHPSDFPCIDSNGEYVPAE